MTRDSISAFFSSLLCIMVSSQLSAAPAPTREDIFHIVEASPLAVAEHDREAWLELFSDTAMLQDPVGSPVLQRQANAEKGDTLGRFYDVFIQPHTIIFHPITDYVSGFDVLRDLTIETRMNSRCTIHVPVFIHYKVTATDRGLRLAQLRAYWDLSENAKAIASQGWNCAAASLKLSSRMLRQLGAGYALHYAAAMQSVGQKGKDRLQELAAALETGNVSHFSSLFAPDATVDCAEDGLVRSPSEFWQYAVENDVRWKFKDKSISAGRTSTARYQFDQGLGPQPGTIMARYAPASLAIEELKCFQEVYQSL